MKNKLLFLLVLLSSFATYSQQWTDITASIGAGISSTTNMSKPYIFDLNNDNYPDFLAPVLSSVTSPYTKYWRLYKNNGNSTFNDVTSSYGLPTNLTSTLGFIDFNGDGFKDLYFYSTTGLQIFKNNNGISFTDVSTQLGISSAFFTSGEITSYPLRVFDYDLDGDEDLLYTRTVSGVNTLTAIVNNGSSFSTKVNILNSIPGGGMNFSFFDMDNDGDFDIVFDAYSSTSQYSNGIITLYRKDATGYTNTTSASGLANGLPGEISTIDINQDGNLDIVKGGADCCTSPLYRVFIGNGAGVFSEQTTSYTISNGGYKYNATLTDFDNDTDFDFSWSNYTGTGAATFRLYVNNGSNVFTENATTYGLNLGVTSGGVPIDDFGNGVWMDIDKDGDLDIILNREGQGSTSTTGNVWVKRNPLQGNYINIKLNGCGVNKSGIGAKIKLVVGTNTKWLYYEKSPDGNITNGTDTFHFGLGSATLINSITVYWPNNTTTVLNNVSGNQFLNIGGGAGGSSAPTGIDSQTLCSGSTVANLTATGTNIQWYATSAGGTALASTTALVNGTTYYASQTVNGCESTTRLEVTVNLNNPTVSASSTTICAGTNVTLTANSNLSTTQIQAQVNNLVNSGLWNLLVTYNSHYYLQYQTRMTWPQAKILCEQNGGYMYCVNSQLENNNVSVQIANSQVYGDFLLGLYQDINDPSYSEPAGGWKWLDGSTFSYTNWASISSGWIVNEPSGGTENFGIMDWSNTGPYWNDTYDNINGTVVMEYIGNSTYLWSTGATTASINVNPTKTTQYWVDVTTNGVTCRKYITITVDSTTSAPTGSTSQTLCSGSTIDNLTATGTNIKWYSTSKGGTALASTIALLNGTTYYASQTVDGCESTTRLAVTVSLNNPVISSTASSVYLGGSVSLTASDLNNYQQINNQVAEFSNYSSNMIGISYNSQLIPTNNFSYDFWFNTNRTITLLSEKTGGVSVQAVNGQNFVVIPDFYNSPYYRGTGISVGTNGISVIEHCGNFFDARLTYSSTLIGWHHCAVVYQNNGFTLFLDGNLVGSRSNGNNFGGFGTQYSTMGLVQTIGKGYPEYDANDNYTGKLDEYRQWSTALSSTQISQIYNRKLQSINMAECNLNLTFDQSKIDNSSSINSELSLSNPTLPSFSFDNSFQVGGFKGTSIFNISNTNLIGTNLSTYVWSTGQTSQTIDVIPPQTSQYWVDVTTNGITCRKYTTITVGSLDTEAFDKSGVSIYPNPTSSLLNVKVDTNIANEHYTISDALGKIVLKGKLNEGATSISVEQLSKGIYFIKLSDNNASKFIKE